ncbi:MAG: hypothetical protein WBA07_34520 [Rivularia sp. (in: cyanobacteria)]
MTEDKYLTLLIKQRRNPYIPYNVKIAVKQTLPYAIASRCNLELGHHSNYKKD